MGILHGIRDRIECMRLRPTLQSLLDGEVTPAERDRVIAHLEACRRCGLSASAYRALKHELQALEPASSPEAVARLETYLQEFVDRSARHVDTEPGEGAS